METHKDNDIDDNNDSYQAQAQPKLRWAWLATFPKLIDQIKGIKVDQVDQIKYKNQMAFINLTISN